jgi:phosphatidylinositol alpha 1,6-mannosyltransferase
MVKEVKMKIALYAGMFKRDQDGATKTLYELTISMLDQGIEVGVWGYKITSQTRKGLHLFKVPSVPLPLYPEYRVSFFSNKIKKQVIEFAPDVIHVAAPDVMGVSLIRFAQLSGIPVLASFHTDFPSYLKFYRLGFLTKPVWRFLQWFYNGCETVMVPSEEVLRQLKDHHILRTKLWSRGIHLDRYNPAFRSQQLRRKWDAENKKVILFCGRFVWYKDLETFIGVYEYFKSKGNADVVFVLAGDGPIKDELQQRMPEAYFPGYICNEELSQVYASSDLFLFPSTTEAFGNVVLEALASGLPAVVSDIGACREIVTNAGAGLVVKANEPHLFYEACKRLLTDTTLYDQCRGNGFEYAFDRSWPMINGRVIDEYKRIRFYSGHKDGSANATHRLVHH